MAVGSWCFLLSFAAATMGILPLDVSYGTSTWYHVLALNIIEPLIMVAIGAALPIIAKLQRKNEPELEE
ncbi:hypothetical protein FC27_GL002231 [Companilactobacillus versmoldensis DSM 14857 = KCTC 3814]|uniref:Uncharacterized protein n=1 Tax=Companilactobacillus versmoldensis DSM 14857 = KCTC 3814 TaxID=1423815 RepID=A0A0R1SE03_9LACO|nr:hypothetical protein FC27_GL002231 [Companilactobacillus versmoldensis DSM 14857 = KCTC 3814]